MEYSEVTGPLRVQLGINIQNVKEMLLPFTFHWPKQVTQPCFSSGKGGGGGTGGDREGGAAPLCLEGRGLERSCTGLTIAAASLIPKQSLVPEAWTPVQLAD